MGAPPLMSRAVRGISRRASRLARRLHPLPGGKVFCIGRNKTGTTSLAKALADLGYLVGDQVRGEMLMPAYARRDFRPILRFCRTAQAFQDLPFSQPFLYQALDLAFPGSKFILSIRRDEDEWYQSLVRFHSRLLKLDRTPRREDLMRAPYRYPGFMWEANRIEYETPEDDPYNEAILKAVYRRHNEDVRSYFRFRDNLLVVNLAEPDSYARFCGFLGRPPAGDGFPHLNRSGND